MYVDQGEGDKEGDVCRSENGVGVVGCEGGAEEEENEGDEEGEEGSC